MVWNVLMILFLIGTAMLIIWSYNHLRDAIDQELEMKRRNQPELGEKTEQEYYEGGALRKETSYRNGIPIGIGREFFKDGRLKKAWNYMEGNKEFVSKEYNTHGQLTIEEYFKAGKIVRRREFDKDGHVTSEQYFAT